MVVTRPQRHPGQPLGLDEILERLYSLGHDATRRPLDMCGGGSAFDCRSLLPRPLALGDTARCLPYGDPQGRVELRELLSARYRRQYGVDISPDRFCITDGASGALHVALATLLERDDEVLVPDVAFPVFESLVHLLGGRSVLVPLSESPRYDRGRIERTINRRTKAVIVNSPNNPHGAVLGRAELEHIASLGVTVISDEVYGNLYYDERPVSLVEISPDAFVLGSFSKEYGACGVRLGYAIVPERLVTRFRSVKATFNVSTSIPSQLIGEQLLAAHDAIVTAHRAFLHERRDLALSLAREHGLAVSTPAAAYYTLVDIGRLGRDSMSAALDLLTNHGVALAPGSDFAVEDPRFLRFNFARPTDDIADALRRVSAYASG